MKTLRILLSLVAVMLVTAPTLLAAAPARAAATRSNSPVLSLADFGVVGGSTLVRTDHGVSVTLHTSALAPGDVVTLWWVVINNPAACEHGIPGVSRCGPPDALNPAARVSVLHAAGRIAQTDGTARYGDHLRVGDTSRALLGAGLLDARGAEVILITKTHGPKIPALTAEMLRTFAGGCHDQSDAPPGAPAELVGTPGPNDCAEIQLSVHSP